MAAIVSSITKDTPNSKYNTGLSKAFGQIIVEKGENYNEKQMRELPALLFEFYVNDVYLENMNRLWTVDNNQPVQLVRMPTDAKVRIVPVFDEDYIARQEEPDEEFDLKVYIDNNISY